MNPFTTKSHSLFSELILLTSSIIVLLALTISWLTLSNITALEKKGHLQALTYIAEEKARNINQYIDLYLNHVTSLSQAPTTQQAMTSFEKSFRQGIQPAAYSQENLKYDTVFKTFLEREHYYDLFLIDNQGNIIYSIKHEADFTSNLNTGAYKNSGLATVFQQARNLLQSNNSTFAYYPPSQEVAAFIASPITHKGKVLGVLAMQFDTSYFYQSIHQLSGLGRTGEIVTGIIHENQLIITSPLRHDADAAFKRSIALDSPIAHAIRDSAQGKTGSGIIIDWRGEEALAVWRYIPALQWGMVVKIDTQEALEAWGNTKKSWLGFVSLALFFGYFLTYLFTQRVTRPLHTLTQYAIDIAAGKQPAPLKSQPSAQYEVNILGQNIKTMIQKISTSKASLQTAVDQLDAQNKKLDQRVAEQTTRIQAVINTASDAIITINAQGVIQTANPATSKMFHYSQEALIGASFAPLLAKLCYAQQHSLIQQTLTQATADNSNPPQEGQGIRQSGETFPLEISTNSMPLNGQELFLIIARDVSKEKHKREQLEHAQRLESLGVLAGGIAHDFNNLLTAILGNTSLAKIRVEKTSSAQPLLSNIEEASERAAALCKQMLAYSGKGKFIIEAINLSDMVQEMMTLLEVSIQKSVFIRLDLAENTPLINADASQIQQVMMNLVINASEAIDKRSGIISIHTGVTHINEAYIKTTYLQDHISVGRYVTLEISDTGCGMDDETKKHLFDPFFTTKFTGRGLGMSAILGIVRGHQGAIKVYSEEGKGSTFKLLFPCATLPLEAINNSPTPAPIITKNQYTVLIVDDEETIREIASMMLEDAGYSVLTASDGIEGLKVFQKYQPQISAILLDMTMPRMGGEEVFRELKILQPGVKVLLSSGYNEQEATNHFAGKGLAGFLQKPYSSSALQNKMAEVLDSHIGNM